MRVSPSSLAAFAAATTIGAFSVWLLFAGRMPIVSIVNEIFLAGSVAFHVTNKGTEEHEFEIFKGQTAVDEIEGLVPGLDRTLSVTLEAGDYTFACKLNGHDAAGMTGTLTVTGS